MATTVKFCTWTGKTFSAHKVGMSGLTVVATKQVQFDTDVMTDLTATIELDDFIDANWCYVDRGSSATPRYYCWFIDDIIKDKQMYSYTLTKDVLSTWWSTVHNEEQLIAECSNSYELPNYGWGKITAGNIPISPTKQVTWGTCTANTTLLATQSRADDYCYVIETTGNLWGNVTYQPANSFWQSGRCLYIATGYGVNELLTYLMNQNGSVLASVKNALFDGGSFIKSIKYFPLNLKDNLVKLASSQGSTQSQWDFAMGWETLPVSTLSHPGSILACQQTMASFYMGCADWSQCGADGYLRFNPYSTYELYLPCYGWKEINPLRYQAEKVYVQYNIDIVTGDCVIRLYYDYDGSTFDQDYCVEELTVNVATNIPFTTYNAFKEGVSIGKDIAEVVAGVMGTNISSTTSESHTKTMNEDYTKKKHGGKTGATVATGTVTYEDNYKESHTTSERENQLESVLAQSYIDTVGGLVDIGTASGGQNNGSSNIMNYLGRVIRLRVFYPNVIDSDWYTNCGKPHNMWEKLEDCTGYCRVQNCNLPMYTMRSEEYRKLVQILESGYYHI